MSTPKGQDSIRMILVSDIVEANGKTVRANNMTLKHSIPIGTLVEVKYHEWFGGGAGEKVHARLWVVAHQRDCDGTPLYILSKHQVDPANGYDMKTMRLFGYVKPGFSEERLTPIEVTPELIYGTGALQWEDPS